MPSALEKSSNLNAAPGPMTRKRFMVRLLSMVGLIALYQIGTMEVLIFHIMNPDWHETWVMLNAPGYVVAVMLGLFTGFAYLYIKPLPDFLARISRGEEIGEDEVRLVQRRGLNFPYLAAVVGFGFYMFGGWWGVHVLVKKLGWPSELEFYGLVAGTVSAFLASPMCVYAYHWVTEPVIRLAGSYAPHLAPSRREGLRLSVRMKLVLTVFSLSMGLATYPMVAGYTQSKLLSDKVDHDRGLASSDSLLRPADANKSLGQFIGERTLVQGRIYLTLLALTIFSSLVLATLASRELTNPILMIRDEALRVSQGDYNRPVTLVSNDEFADLGMALNRMNDTIIGQVRVMESVVTTLRQGIHQMDDVVRTVHDISSEQATGATEQAAAVQQSSSIAQEIVASAAQIAERAGLMDEVAAATTQACREGEQKLEEARQGFHDISVQVGQVWSAMDELQERFMETYKIVEWMDDISEQTELLALNAALEAAGAGEAGKRFSVVAQSTRRLAQRSRDAVQEIRALVETIQKATLETTRISDLGKQKMSRGGAAIEDAVSALQNISSFAGSASSAIREITLSTQQQTTASEQLAHSVREVQEVAQKVEEGAREIQSAITELKSFSQSLQSTLEK